MKHKINHNKSFTTL